MAVAISNTSPLFYLCQIGSLDFLARLFDEVWISRAVVAEVDVGREKGFEIPTPDKCPWLKIVNPTNIPSEWLTSSFGPGELATMALALEYPMHVVLLDDALARRTAQAAGLHVWGILRVLLEAKTHELTELIEPHVDALSAAGMWISRDLRERILKLAGEEGKP
jgi:predicted nucleic acid-binding protein